MSNAVVLGGKAVFEAAAVGSSANFSGTLEILLPANAKLKSGSHMACTKDLIVNVQLPVSYLFNGFDRQGSGTLIITALNPNQQSAKLTIAGIEVVLVGSQFDGLFSFSAPSQKTLPPGGTLPAPMPTHPVKGTLVTALEKIKA